MCLCCFLCPLLCRSRGSLSVRVSRPSISSTHSSGAHVEERQRLCWRRMLSSTPPAARRPERFCCWSEVARRRMPPADAGVATDEASAAEVECRHAFELLDASMRSGTGWSASCSTYPASCSVSSSTPDLTLAAGAAAGRFEFARVGVARCQRRDPASGDLPMEEWGMEVELNRCWPEPASCIGRHKRPLRGWADREQRSHW